ncbi:MAG: sigma factor-like helix-turn-helix DNA-binding protein [Myxococcaceae bacterium]
MEQHDLYLSCCAVWPKVRLGKGDFDQACQQRAPLEEQRAADVFLAAAIERHDPAAISWLRGAITDALRAMAGRVPQEHWADIESDLLSCLTVPPARITAYSGKGALAGWVRIVVVREALKHSTAPLIRLEEQSFENAVWQDLESTAPELAVMRERFSGAVGLSLKTAIDQLSARERSLLRLHFLDGVTLDELARAYQVHSATVARWLASAKECFLTHTRDQLAQRAGVNRLEVDSLVRVLQDRADLSLRTALASHQEPA